MIFDFISMMQKSRNPTAEAYAGQWGLPTHHKRPYKLFYGFIQHPISFTIFQVVDKQVQGYPLIKQSFWLASQNFWFRHAFRSLSVATGYSSTRYYINVMKKFNLRGCVHHITDYCDSHGSAGKENGDFLALLSVTSVTSTSNA